MKRFNGCILLLVATSYLLNSCSPNDPQLSDMTGKWYLSSIDSYIDESTADPLRKTKSYEGEGLYFDFRGTRIFSTNTDLSISKILVAEANPNPGSFYYTQDRNGITVEIELVDPQLNQLVTLFFEGQNFDTDHPILYMNKANYLKSIRESANNQTPEIQKSLNLFANRINEAWFSLEFVKQ